MTHDPEETISAFLDGEQVDPAVLSEALSAPSARAALADFAMLRAGLLADESRPGREFYSRMEAILRPASLPSAAPVKAEVHGPPVDRAIGVASSPASGVSEGRKARRARSADGSSAHQSRWWSLVVPIPAPMLAAAAVLMVVLGLAALRGIGGGPGARTDAPPQPDRVIAFQQGVDWGQGDPARSP